MYLSPVTKLDADLFRSLNLEAARKGLSEEGNGFPIPEVLSRQSMSEKQWPGGISLCLWDLEDPTEH